MDVIINILKNLLGFGQGNERTNKAKKNITVSFIITVFSILISLIIVPMTINYINPTRYGIWVTLSSIIGWFSFFDIGLGNGLRNKFADAVSLGEKELARIYISTTYVILSIIISIILLLFFIVNPFLNWSNFLNAPSDMAHELSILALIVFCFFCVRFVLQLISTILVADQNPAIASLLTLLGSALSLVIIFIITKTTQGSLIYLGFALGFTPIFVLGVSSVLLFKTRYKIYSPSVKYVKFSYAKDLMNLGIKFFIIQIAAVILYQTNNIIIAQLFGPDDVTIFNIAYKYFGVIIMVYSIIITPFWSAFTEAFKKNEIPWIKQVTKGLIIVWGITCLLSVIMLGFSNLIYRFWIGNSIKIPFTLSLVCTFYVIIVTWCNIFITFINGTGKISLQLVLTCIVIIINIPLAVFLSKYLHMGIAGVLLATCLDFLIFALIIPIQYIRIINGNAKGIWNK